MVWNEPGGRSAARNSTHNRVSGLGGVVHSKSGVTFFGLRLPAWLVPHHDAAEQFFSVHEALAWFFSHPGDCSHGSRVQAFVD
jgi:hypothetical protein